MKAGTTARPRSFQAVSGPYPTLPRGPRLHMQKKCSIVRRPSFLLVFLLLAKKQGEKGGKNKPPIYFFLKFMAASVACSPSRQLVLVSETALESGTALVCGKGGGRAEGEKEKLAVRLVRVFKKLLCKRCAGKSHLPCEVS